jgi:putative peptide zinc metalloprotease protein
VGVSLLNLNPLIKLDGYLIFSELVAEPALKETSTVYLTAWARQHIFQLPAHVPYVPRRKRPFYVVYAILSGLYSYSLLSFLMVITYHILRSYTPEWAFLPASAIGLWVFRSRVKLLAAFMKMIYLDKKERVRSWFTLTRIAVAATAALVVLMVPIWPDFVEGPFVLEAGQTALIRATVPGTVEGVAVHEGQSVAAGAELLRLRNSAIQSEAALAGSQLADATARENQAALQYTDFAAAQQERQRQTQNLKVATERTRQLSITAPISGVVATSHVSDLVGQSVAEGDLLLQVDEVDQVKASVYIPEFAMHDLRNGQKVRMLATGQVAPLSGVVSSVTPRFVLAEGLVSKDQLQGINPPRYYVATAWLKNNGELRSGMTGRAKVLVAHRSLTGFAFEFTRDLISTRIW